MKSILKKSILKLRVGQLALAVIAILFTAAIAIPFLIKMFFTGLLYSMENPIMAIIISGSFIAGMLVNEAATRLDSKNC